MVTFVYVVFCLIKYIFCTSQVTISYESPANTPIPATIHYRICKNNGDCSDHSYSGKRTTITFSGLNYVDTVQLKVDSNSDIQVSSIELRRGNTDILRHEFDPPAKINGTFSVPYSVRRCQDDDQEKDGIWFYKNFGDTKCRLCHCKPGKKCPSVHGGCPNNDCAEEYYGTSCSDFCSKNCGPVPGGDRCSAGSSCMRECVPGYRGNQCTEQCAVGSWGETCNEQCPARCSTTNCSHVDGNCFSCKNGWAGSHCDEACVNCEHNTCDRVDGQCTVGCITSFWGRDACDQLCINCRDDKCYRHTGACINGCKLGWWQQSVGICDEPCINCKNDKCNQDSGKCSDGCASGFWGKESCTKPCITKAPCDDRDQTKYCPKRPSPRYDKYTYDVTYNGETATIQCTKGTLTRTCMTALSGIQAEWGSEIDTDCLTPEDMLDKMQMITRPRQKLAADDIPRFVKDLGLLAEFPTNNRTVVKRIISMFGNLIEPESSLPIAEKRGFDAYDVVVILEKLASRIAITDTEDTTIQTNDIAIHVSNISPENKPFKFHFYFGGADKNNAGPSVSIPSNTLKELKQTKNTRLQMIAFRNSRLFTKDTGHSVVSINFNNPIETNTDRVAVMYQMPYANNTKKKMLCVYWNIKSTNWSSVGISSITDKAGKTFCSSTHFSSFSMLMIASSSDKPTTKEQQASLTLISYIGCGISIAGLLLTIITYSLFKCLRRDKSGKILLNICVSMLFLNSSFFLHDVLDSESYNKTACMVVANLLHYFLLTTLVWMMIEALHMYQKLIIVFSESGSWFMRVRMSVGWGVPIVVVAITAALTTDDYEPKQMICFLSSVNQLAFYTAVLAPSCLILLVNLFVFIRVTMIVFRQQSIVKDADTTASVVSLIQVRGAMSVMIVLGVTWVFGPLAIGPLEDVFTYLFTVLNSIQGFLVFLFRCVFYSEARWAWKLFIYTGRIKQRRGSLSETTGWASEKTGNTWRTRANKVASEMTEVEQSLEM